MHYFGNARYTGYGACSYLKPTNVAGTIATSLVIGKSYVTPSKTWHFYVRNWQLQSWLQTSATSPRKISDSLHPGREQMSFTKEEVRYEDLRHVFWADSSVVLGYIANKSQCFHEYVANRVHKSQDKSSTQWRFITSTTNPTDLASRGANAKDLINSNLRSSGSTAFIIRQDSWD